MKYLAFLLTVCLIPIIYLACLDTEAELEWTVITDGRALIEPLCDSVSECTILTPNYTFEDVTLVMTMYKENGHWVLGDTLYANGELFIEPYVAIALLLNVSDSLICSGFIMQGNLMSFSGQIAWDNPYQNGDHAFRVDEVDHPYYQLGFFRDCN